jgi:xanthine dehydrogenase molybdopterin-binding subunit B
MRVEDNILAPLLSKLELSAQYRRGREAVLAWNTSNPIIKRGIAITPVKFGISFTATLFNQAGALVHVYNREDNVFGSKAVGEPPFMLAISVYEALRDAIASVGDGRPVQLTAPATAENVLRALAG